MYIIHKFIYIKENNFFGITFFPPEVINVNNEKGNNNGKDNIF